MSHYFFKGITLVFCGQNDFVRARRELVGNGRGVYGDLSKNEGGGGNGI